MNLAKTVETMLGGGQDETVKAKCQNFNKYTISHA